jgi:hypothetical protein
VNLPDQAQAYRKFVEASEPMVQGSNVVDHFPDILWTLLPGCVGLELQHIFQSALGSFDL